MTIRSEQRSRITSIGLIAELGVNTVMTLLLLPLIKYLGGGSDHSPAGWFGGVMASTLLLCALGLTGVLMLRENNRSHSKKQERVTPKDFLALFSEKTVRYSPSWCSLPRLAARSSAWAAYTM